jgi:hypothetical protein
VIPLAFALLLTVSQHVTDYTSDPEVARFEKGVTFIVAQEKHPPTKKTPYVQPALKPARRVRIRPEDLTAPVPPLGD